MGRDRTLWACGVGALVAGVCLPVAAWAVSVVNGPDCPTTGHGTSTAASNCQEPASLLESLRAAVGLRSMETLASSESTLPVLGRSDSAGASENVRTRTSSVPQEPMGLAENAAAGQRTTGGDGMSAAERATLGSSKADALTVGDSPRPYPKANKQEPATLLDDAHVTYRKGWSDAGTVADSARLFATIRPIMAGWNLVSIPIAASNSKVFATPGTIGTTAQDGLFNSQHVAIAYKFDGNTQTWVLVTASTTLAPLEALMLQANQSTNLTLIYNPANSGAPNRVLGKGWNLVGVAVPPETTSQPVDQALLSVYQTASGEWGYETVVSPGGLNQPAFLWTRGQPAPPMLRWRGYWVLMANADTLEGSSTTPLP